LNLPSALVLMMRSTATTMVASHMVSDIQKNGFLHSRELAAVTCKRHVKMHETMPCDNDNAEY
jgi:hypothetical protein